MSELVTEQSKVNDLVPPNLEEILIKQDLRSLKPEQRILYVKNVCESLGLNPLTKPFEFVEFDGKVILYATKDCANQLRMRYKISIKILEQKLENDVIRVRVQASTPDGRVDEDFGALSIVTKYGKANGQNLANLEMKCVTKAKRRVTLSICGLGFLDETEVEDSEASVRVPEYSVEDQTEDDIFAPIDPIDDAIGPLYLIKRGKFRDIRVCEIEYEELQKYVDYCEQRFTKNPALKSKDDEKFMASAKMFLTNYQAWKANPLKPPYTKRFNKDLGKFEIEWQQNEAPALAKPIKGKEIQQPSTPKEELNKPTVNFFEKEDKIREDLITRSRELCLKVHGKCTEITEKWLHGLSIESLEEFITEQSKYLSEKENQFTQLIKEIDKK